VVDPEVDASAVAEPDDDDDDDVNGGAEDDGADGVAPPKKHRASIARSMGISEEALSASIEAGAKAFTTIARMQANAAASDPPAVHGAFGGGGSGGGRFLNSELHRNDR
jgi:hypothetical protein